MQKLVPILVEARALVACPGNDFGWSSWDDEHEALAQLDHLIDTVRRGGFPKDSLDVLFAPTGAMQEVSLSSGWGQELLDLAERYDRVVGNPTGDS